MEEDLCDCRKFERSRKFESIIKNLPKKDKKWMEGILDEIYHT